MRQPAKYLITGMLITLAVIATSYGQAKDKSGAALELSSAVRSSPAFAEILLRKTEILADIEAFSAGYMDQSPKMLDLRFELGALNASLAMLAPVKPGDAGKLTNALGRLILKKAVLETEFARLSRSYNNDHPDVKRAAKRVEIFEHAIKEILY